jgi:hypothetical protein
MNNECWKTLIKHYNVCFLTLKWHINRLQNFWKLYIFWNILYKPWNNNIFKIILKINFFKRLYKKYYPKNNSKNMRLWFVLSGLHPHMIICVKNLCHINVHWLTHNNSCEKFFFTLMCMLNHIGSHVICKL